jgi:2-amino-4-hydroxy-6-hydroxymethyldihydropteridine diphosphokinase
VILIALGANLAGLFGSPEEALVKAIDEIERRGVSVVAKSRIWITPPVPVSDQPDYRNAVISVDTELSPQAVLGLLHGIEADFGRTRFVRNEARIIDLDLIAHHDWIIADDELELPHPRMHQRAFVLVPLCDIAPDWIHPVLKKSALSMLQDLESSDIVAVKVAA